MTSCGDINFPIRPDNHAHGEFEAIGKDGRTVAFAIVVRVFKDQKPVRIMAFIILGTKVGVGFYGPDTALVVDIKTSGCHDLGLFGIKRNREPIIHAPGLFTTLFGRSCRWSFILSQRRTIRVNHCHNSSYNRYLPNSALDVSSVIIHVTLIPEWVIWLSCVYYHLDSTESSGSSVKSDPSGKIPRISES